MGVRLAWVNPNPPVQPPRIHLHEGDVVIESPVGPGKITGFSQRGYPEVNHITVAYLKRADGTMFDPHGHYR